MRQDFDVRVRREGGKERKERREKKVPERGFPNLVPSRTEKRRQKFDDLFERNSSIFPKKFPENNTVGTLEGEARYSRRSRSLRFAMTKKIFPRDFSDFHHNILLFGSPSKLQNLSTIVSKRLICCNTPQKKVL